MRSSCTASLKHADLSFSSLNVFSGLLSQRRPWAHKPDEIFRSPTAERLKSVHKEARHLGPPGALREPATLLPALVHATRRHDSPSGRTLARLQRSTRPIRRCLHAACLLRCRVPCRRWSILLPTLSIIPEELQCTAMLL